MTHNTVRLPTFQNTRYFHFRLDGTILYFSSRAASVKVAAVPNSSRAWSKMGGGVSRWNRTVSSFFLKAISTSGFVTDHQPHFEFLRSADIGQCRQRYAWVGHGRECGGYRWNRIANTFRSKAISTSTFRFRNNGRHHVFLEKKMYVGLFSAKPPLKSTYPEMSLMYRIRDSSCWVSRVRLAR
jgi:hypothetical protein